MFSIINNYENFIGKLIENGADVNIKDRHGLNALLLYINHEVNNPDLFKLLIEKTYDLMYSAHSFKNYNFIDIINKDFFKKNKQNVFTNSIQTYDIQSLLLKKSPLLIKQLMDYKLIHEDIEKDFKHLINENDLNLL